MVDDRGISTTLRSATGELIEQGRLRGAVDSYYASPIVADDKFYLLSRSGKLVVLPSDGSLEPLARLGSRRPGHGDAGDRPDDDVPPHAECAVGFSAFG